MSDLDIVVLIKQVPEMEKVKFDVEKGRLDRSSAGVEVNPFDLNALEQAVRIKEDNGGKVTAMSMGPSRAESALREALARGADRAILISDRAFAGADTWATSLTLSTAIKKLDGFDLIICGEKTVDSDTGQVGPAVAEFLKIPHVAYVTEVKSADGDGLTVAQDIWGGIYLKELKFPGLITVTKDINEPRLPTLQDKLKSRRATIEVWNMSKFADVLEPEDVGLCGSPTRLRAVEDIIPQSKECEMLEGDTSEAVEKLVSGLKTLEIV
ncbi:MAG: electron transfer flavoprotein subunit beta/FixA family protein [Chloroflexota bacterium]|nr:electron transfer flavoprotein subunit beta/FixA family protein [Chloroflexota bacterium]